MATFIEKHGLVQYTKWIHKKYPFDKKCEIVGCETSELLNRIFSRFYRLEYIDECNGDYFYYRKDRKSGDQWEYKYMEWLCLEDPEDWNDEFIGIGLIYPNPDVMIHIRSHDKQRNKYRQNEFVLDHCHAHGWIRGVLCRSCNGIMGGIDACDRYANTGSRRFPFILPNEMYMKYRTNCPECIQ